MSLKRITALALRVRDHGITTDPMQLLLRKVSVVSPMRRERPFIEVPHTPAQPHSTASLNPTVLPIAAKGSSGEQVLDYGAPHPIRTETIHRMTKMIYIFSMARIGRLRSWEMYQDGRR